jgi:hypothetical protein
MTEGRHLDWRLLVPGEHFSPHLLLGFDYFLGISFGSSFWMYYNIVLVGFTSYSRGVCRRTVRWQYPLTPADQPLLQAASIEMEIVADPPRAKGKEGSDMPPLT